MGGFLSQIHTASTFGLGNKGGFIGRALDPLSIAQPPATPQAPAAASAPAVAKAEPQVSKASSQERANFKNSPGRAVTRRKGQVSQVTTLGTSNPNKRPTILGS